MRLQNAVTNFNVLCFINTSFYQFLITKKVHFLLYAFFNELNLLTDIVKKKNLFSVNTVLLG